MMVWMVVPGQYFPTLRHVKFFERSDPPGGGLRMVSTVCGVDWDALSLSRCLSVLKDLTHHEELA